MFKIFNKAEWVCIGFLLFAAFRITTAPIPLDWSTVRWSTFPRTDILFITIAVWILKLSRQHRLVGVSTLGLLVLSFYAYSGSGNSEQAFLPIREYLGPILMELIVKLRFFLMALVLSAIGFMCYRNTIVIREALNKIRIIIPFFIIVYLYPFVPLIIQPGHVSGIHDYDQLLSKMDSWLFLGQNPILILETWIKPTLSEWMAFSYSSYGPIFAIVFGCLYLKEEDYPAQEMIFMSTLALALGYASYTFIPARGPMFMQKFRVPLDLYYMKEFKDLYMDQPRIDRDCFPSLHTAVTMISLFSAWKFIRPLFWMILPVAIFIPIACVYLRYHYVVDVLAGILLSLLIILLASKTRKEKRV
jgi:membrane-associated phospholipid phosphatase